MPRQRGRGRHDRSRDKPARARKPPPSLPRDPEDLYGLPTPPHPVMALIDRLERADFHIIGLLRDLLRCEMGRAKSRARAVLARRCLACGAFFEVWWMRDYGWHNTRCRGCDDTNRFIDVDDY